LLVVLVVVALSAVVVVLVVIGHQLLANLQVVGLVLKLRSH
jgi:hypothetical protein